jgi:hypothetical protein
MTIVNAGGRRERLFGATRPARFLGPRPANKQD